MSTGLLIVIVVVGLIIWVYKKGSDKPVHTPSMKPIVRPSEREETAKQKVNDLPNPTATGPKMNIDQTTQPATLADANKASTNTTPSSTPNTNFPVDE